MRIRFRQWFIIGITTLLLTCAVRQPVFADDNTASTMRLARYEGEVEVEGPGGDPKTVMENMRFADGDTLSTGLESTASVSLDTGRILTVAPSSRVAFSQQGQKLKLTLTEGELFLDVKEKLGEEETLDIQTSTMAIGIRGTIVYVSDRANQDTTAGRITTFGVLEGTADISYTDTSGTAQSISVPAGERLILRDADGNGLTDAEPEATVMTAADIAGFVAEQIQKDETVLQRVQNASDVLENTVDKFAADGDWTWNEPVTLIAQSASKLYDGSALTRPSDVLVYGLPSDFSIQTRAGGSQIDAGESSNPVSSYVIFNRNGEDVTGHFTGIRTVAGKLKVDPAPLTIWTGSAEKVYDGTPLTEPETQIRTVPGYEAGDPLWRDTAYVGAAARGYETLYGVCGTTWVHGTNPLTGEIREIELPAGKKMTVYLSDEDGKQSIEFRIEDMAEGEIPEDVLRLYADNPDLLTQACKDTGWDEEIIRRLIELLPEKEDEDTVEQSDLTIARSASERLMQDSTNVRIHIDTENTSYNNRALGDKEAHFTGVHIDSSIKITATGSQTDVGQSANTYTIDWGTANPNNYILSEELGTLTVTPAALTVTTGSAEKKYDGEPLTSEEATLTGLVNGETAAITATGTITDTGSVPNTYTIDWGKTKSSNYTITEQLGTLTVTDADAPVYDDPVTLTASSSEKTYDGTPLTASSVTVSGLPEGFTAQATAAGSQTDAGSSTATVTSYTILDEDGNDVTAQCTNVTTVSGTLTVTPASLTVTTSTAEKAYDGTPLNGTVTVTGLVNGETVTATAASITDAGTAANTYTIDWGNTDKDNYTVTEDLGTLTVTPASLTITTSTAEKVYDGTPLNGTVTVTGLVNGETVTAAAASITDAGTAANTYTIDWGNTNKDNYTVTEDLGTLTVTQLPVEFDMCCSYMEGIEYSGHPIIPEGMHGIYTISGEEVDISDDWEYTLDEKEYYTACTYTANLIGGAKAKITVSGCTDAGSYTIDPDCTFAEGKESNYFISYTNNTLEILPAPLTIKASDSKPYDGTPLDGSDLEVTTEGLAEGEEITVTADGTITNAGTLEIGTEEIPYIIDWGSVNKDNYSVTEQPGTLTVTPADLTIKASGSKPYDGTPLIGQDVVTIDGLAERDRASFKVTATGTITDIGEADNPYTIDWGTVEQGNYSFTEETEEKGTLTVEKATLTMSLSYTGYEATDTSLRLYNFALTVTSNSAVEPVVVSEGNTWPSPYYSVILYDGTFPVYYSGDSCRWKVTVPGDTFSVSVFCSGTDGSYIELFCSCIGEINNYLITRNNPRIIIGNRTTESSDSDSSDTSDSTDMSTLSSTKKDRKIAADIDEKKDDAIKEEPEKNSEDTKETDAVDNPEKEAILEEAVDPAEESGNGTEPEDGMTEKGAEAEKTDGESDKEDTPSKEDAAVSEEKTDPASDGTEKDKEKTAADKDSSEKPDTGNISADEKKPESGSDTRSVGRDDPAESTGTIGDAIVNAGAQAGSAVVSAVETVGENTVNRVSAAESDGGQTEGDT